MSKLRTLGVALFLAGVLSGCRFEPVHIERNGVVFCVDSGISVPDPLIAELNVTSITLARNVFNRLVNFSPVTDSYAPELAESWAQLESDPRIVRFILKTNVRFQETPWFKPTRPMNADDVVFSYRRLISIGESVADTQGTDVESQGFGRIMQAGKLIKSVRKSGDYSVDFTLSSAESLPLFLELASHPNSVIYSSEFMDYLRTNKPYAAESYFRTHLVGTGVFRQVNYKYNDFISLERSLSHASEQTGESKKIDRLILAITPLKSRRMNKMVTDECQIANQPDSRFLNAKSQSKLTTIGSDSIDSMILFFNTQKNDLAVPYARHAIASLFDREVYRNIIFPDTGIVPKLMIPLGDRLRTNDQTMLPEKKSNREEILELIGIDSRIRGLTRELKVIVDVGNSRSVYGASRVGIQIKKDLESAGLRVKLLDNTSKETKKAITRGDYDLLVVPVRFTKHMPLYKLHHILKCKSDGKPNPTNYSKLCEPEIDRLINLHKFESPEDMDADDLSLLHRLLSEHMPYFPLAYSSDSYIAIESMHGLRKSANGLDFSDVRIK